MPNQTENEHEELFKVLEEKDVLGSINRILSESGLHAYKIASLSFETAQLEIAKSFITCPPGYRKVTRCVPGLGCYQDCEKIPQ